MKNYYLKYCTGCGLCKNCGYTDFNYKEDGFPYPSLSSKKQQLFCEEVCPIGSKSLNRYMSSKIWGNYKSYYTGFSCDNHIRFKAASGGILTTLCIELLKSKKIDGVLQTTFDSNHPTESITVVSKSPEDIIACCGSRYCVSSPLINLNSLLEPNHKYAFVGKPCDVAALRNYSKKNKEIKNSIVYYFSFFCAGTPSKIANKDLLNALGCPEESCSSLSYRGNGWPGFITAIDDNGQRYMMDYQSAWTNILGRVIRKSCKFCVDSIGERADISCGDYWYLDQNNKPIFAENDGINCIFAWTEKGKSLLEHLQKNNSIVLNTEKIELLKQVQPNHYYRRATILYRWLGLKIFFKQTPKFPICKMLSLAKNISIKEGLGCLKGTIIRVIKGSV